MGGCEYQGSGGEFLCGMFESREESEGSGLRGAANLGGLPGGTWARDGILVPCYRKLLGRRWRR